MRELLRFAAALAVVMGFACLLLGINRGAQWQFPIDDARVEQAANPGTWPTTASLAVSADAPQVEIRPAATNVIAPPPAPASRAKFRGEDPGVVDGLAFVNKMVNHVIQPIDDLPHYGVQEQMVSWPQDLKGDCEDYALSKLVTLINSGVGVVEYTRLRFLYATAPDGELYGHVVLEVRMPRGSIAFLDNNFDPLMTRAELEARGYHFFDW